jgi:hypothetical protein
VRRGHSQEQRVSAPCTASSQGVGPNDFAGSGSSLSISAWPTGDSKPAVIGAPDRRGCGVGHRAYKVRGLLRRGVRCRRVGLSLSWEPASQAGLGGEEVRVEATGTAHNSPSPRRRFTIPAGALLRSIV